MMMTVTYYTLELEGIEYVVGEKIATGEIIRFPLEQVRPLRENERSEPLPVNVVINNQSGKAALSSPVAGSEQSPTPVIASKPS